MTTISQALLEAYQEFPNKVILNFVSGGHADQPITYKDLVENSLGYSRILNTKGVSPGTVVILIQQHSLELIYTYFGCIFAGLIPSIMPFLTEKLLPERYRTDLISLLHVTQPESIITYPDFKDDVYSAIQEAQHHCQLIIADYPNSEKPEHFQQIPGLSRSESDIAILQHSSGTTGLQKGVALSHKAVFSQINSYSKAIRLSASDVIVSWLPLYHDMGLIAGFLMPFLKRIPLTLMSPFEWVRSPVKLLQMITKYQGTISWLPNFAYNFCAQKIRDRELTDINLSTWRAVINCSEPMRLQSHQAFYERFAKYGLKESALCTSYAMAENVFAVTQGGIDSEVTIDRIDRDKLQFEKVAQPAQPLSATVEMVSAGKPIEDTEVIIFGEGNLPLPERCIGEIAISSPYLLSEYYHRPDITHKSFHKGWFLTGDLGYIANGELYITGRKKDLIIVGGKNIYPQDIENLVMQVPGVHTGRVSAFGIFNDLSGTEEVVVVAEVENDQWDQRDSIEDQIRNTVTRGSAIALRNVYLVKRHWLIKTSSGKTARSANREKYLLEISNTELAQD